MPGQVRRVGRPVARKTAVQSFGQLILAVRVGFEPTEPVKVQRFSRPPDSTTLAPHRIFILSDSQSLPTSVTNRSSAIPAVSPIWHHILVRFTHHPLFRFAVRVGVAHSHRHQRMAYRVRIRLVSTRMYASDPPMPPGRARRGLHSDRAVPTTSAIWVTQYAVRS